MSEKKHNPEMTDEPLSSLSEAEMEEAAGGIPYESVNENNGDTNIHDCPSGGSHNFKYTGNEKPGDVLSFWPDKEMVCTKCGKKKWVNW